MRGLGLGIVTTGLLSVGTVQYAETILYLMNLPIQHPADPVLLGGRYLLGERIASGGMGSIFKAIDTQMDREVAVKTLHPHLSSQPDVRERFQREATMAAKLVDAHVVAVFDQGDEPYAWIVMELINGPSLRNVLSVAGPLTPSVVRSIVRPLAVALARAHEIGIIHRDVKPENVLITLEGVPKLADFGIADLARPDVAPEDSDLLGSVHYLSPEVINGESASPASDQYALGAMTYELLTGLKPLPASTPAEILARHASEAIPAPSQMMPGLSAEIDHLVAKMTALRVEDRFPDMRAVADAIAQAIAGHDEPIQLRQLQAANHTMMLRRDQLPAFIPTHQPKRRFSLVWVLLILVVIGAVVWWQYGQDIRWETIVDFFNG